MVKNLFFALGFMLGAVHSNAQYLDSTFGTYGIVSTSFVGIREQCSTVVVQPDGKVLTGGFVRNSSGTDQFAIARYDTSGVLDNTFGTGGKVMMPNNGINNELKGMTLQPDGKILAAGMEMVGSFSPWNTLLARFNTNGTLDNTFGTGGKAITPVGTKADAYKILVQPDGKILICGTQYDDNFYIILRYNANGTLDNTFGTGGIVQATSFGTGVSMALQPDGKILVCGEFWSMQGPCIGVARHNANGSVDNTFGTNGSTVIYSPYGSTENVWGAHDIKLLPDGRFLIPVTLSSIGIAHEPAIIRFTSSGMLDASFGNFNGFATGTYSNFYESGEKLAIQPDGKILIAGYVQGSGNTKDSLFVMRFDTSGARDNTFGVLGRITARLDTAGSSAWSIALQDNGKFLVAGVIGITGTRKNMLARYRYAPTVVTGIANTAPLGNIIVYPNPASDKVYIDLGDVSSALVNVTDITGKIIASKDITKDDNAINVKTLPPGSYIISVTAGGYTSTHHFEKL